MKRMKGAAWCLRILTVFCLALWLLPMTALADDTVSGYENFKARVEKEVSGMIGNIYLDTTFFEWPEEEDTIYVRNYIWLAGDWEIPSNITLVFPNETGCYGQIGSNGLNENSTLTVRGKIKTEKSNALNCNVKIADGGLVSGTSVYIPENRTITLEKGGSLSVSRINSDGILAGEGTLENLEVSGGYSGKTSNAVLSGNWTISNISVGSPVSDYSDTLKIPSGSSITLGGYLNVYEGHSLILDGSLVLADRASTVVLYPGSRISSSAGTSGKITGTGRIRAEATENGDGTYTGFPAIFGNSPAAIAADQKSYSDNVAETVRISFNWINTTGTESGNTGSDNTGSDNTGSDNTDSGNTDSGNTDSKDPESPEPDSGSLTGTVSTLKNITYKVTGKNTASVSIVKNKKITSAAVPAAVNIGGQSFKVTTIENNAFSGCTKLKQVTIGKNVTSIGDKAFYNCKMLSSVTIPSSVKMLGSSAFAKCVKLTSVKGCEGLTSVGASAFSGCTKLKTVKGFKKVTSVGSKAFYNCKALTAVGSTGSTVTLAKVQTIGSSAFYGCKALKKINLSSTALKSINDMAFKNCGSITSFVSKSAKLTKIGKQAFYGDKKLASVTLKTAKLSSSKIGSNAFKGIKNSCKFKVPSSKVKSYKKVFTAKGASSSIKLTK